MYHRYRALLRDIKCNFAGGIRQWIFFRRGRMLSKLGQDTDTETFLIMLGGAPFRVRPPRLVADVMES